MTRGPESQGLPPSQPRSPLRIDPQPDDTTCGPTCLHALYRYYGEELALGRVIEEIPPLPQGGTLAVLLACHALRRGYGAEITTYNLQLFDPTWFTPEVDLAGKLRAQLRHKRSKRLALATAAYLEFLELGGRVTHETLTPELLLRLLERGPVITGLNATYLYGCPREHGLKYDDVRGTSTGHFVVLWDYDPKTRSVHVSDPLSENPAFSGLFYYDVDLYRLLGSVLLGILTHDANLLVLEPPAKQRR